MAEPGYRDQYRKLTQGMGGYSAQDAYEKSTAAALRLAERPFREDDEQFYAGQVGKGRVGTGFGMDAAARRRRDREERVQDMIASRGLATQQLELQGRGLEGDLLSGGLDREEAEKNAKRKRKGGLFGAIGGIAGGVLGSVVPGVGTALGGYLGGKLGGAVGQYL
jgi:hypothetical protein